MRWRIKNRLTQERSHGNTYAVGKPQIFLFGTINRKPNPELQPHVNFLNYQQFVYKETAKVTLIPKKKKKKVLC